MISATEFTHTRNALVPAFMAYESGWSTPALLAGITVAHIDVTEDGVSSSHVPAPVSSTRQIIGSASKEHRHSWQKSMNMKLRRSLCQAAVSLGRATVAVRSTGDSPTNSENSSSDVSPESSEGSPCLELDDAERAARRAARLARWTSDKMVVSDEFRHLGEDAKGPAVTTGAM